MFCTKALSFLFSLSAFASAKTGDPGFCQPGYQLAWVTFDFNKNWTPINAGDYVTDIGFGFTITARPSEDGVTGGGPRIYDSNAVGGLDPDLEVKLGNLLIVQQADSEEPNDNRKGGSIVFHFEEATDIYSVQLVDTEETTRVITFSEAGRVSEEAETVPDGGVQDFLVNKKGIDKMKIKFTASGAIGNLKMCIPECKN